MYSCVHSFSFMFALIPLVHLSAPSSIGVNLLMPTCYICHSICHIKFQRVCHGQKTNIIEDHSQTNTEVESKLSGKGPQHRLLK